MAHWRAALTQGLTILFFSIYGAAVFPWVLNNPYPAEESSQKIYYSSFEEQPKTLDPVKSYSYNEYLFLGQIYEPLLQYDYLKRPFQLAPLAASRMPDIYLYDKTRRLMSAPYRNNDVARSVYVIHIKPGVYFQPHPAFAKKNKKQYRYYPLPDHFLTQHAVNTLSDFKYVDTRELTADDYIYQIKRLASPKLNSPIYGLMAQYILGFKEYGRFLPRKKHAGQYIDLRQYALAGVKKRDRYTFEITLKGQYTPFLYWLAMSFFAPIPWEVDRFYTQPGMAERNLSFGWFPVGTGPFMLSENNPNNRMVLTKNPHYHGSVFPAKGSLQDKQQGYLQHAGERVPLIDKAVYTLEKESIPRWSKFIQGYYDLSSISSDSFDQAVQVSAGGNIDLSESMRQRGITLTKSTDPSIFYLGFNLLDPIVGGSSERARYLRQAIAMAVNYDEYIAIFLNGRGKSLQSPIPPGIFGHGVGPQHTSYDQATLEQARQLMIKAGYPQGRDPKTGQALVLHYDVSSTGGPDDKSQMDWMQKQFAKLGIALDIRATQYNRFQDKLRHGNTQIFYWGWGADYPDPENFLFLLYGPNSKALHGGENASNYHNAHYDALFDAMRNLPNGPQRLHYIKKMMRILQYDRPWAGGVYNQSYTLAQSWMSPVKSSHIINNTLKYMVIDVAKRQQLRQAWNRPILWPFGLMLLGLILLLLPFMMAYRHKLQRTAERLK